MEGFGLWDKYKAPPTTIKVLYILQGKTFLLGLLIPLGENKTTNTFLAKFEGNFIKYLARTMNTGLLHTRDSQRMAVSSVYKGKTHKVTYYLPLSNQGQAYILVYFLPMFLLPSVIKHILRSWGNQPCYRCENTWLVILHEQQPPALQGVVCPWASGAYRLRLFLFLDLLSTVAQTSAPAGFLW